MKNNYSRFVVIALLSIILFLFFMTIKGYGAEKEIYFQTTISGKVVDKEGLPIPGVAVNIKNSNKGTVTNLDGIYSIEAAPNAVLVFSYLGFKTQEIPVQGRSEINITLQEDVLALDEVEINAGYYNTTRRESTANISRVTAEEIEMQPVVSPLEALQGRMAGVEVIPGGSQVGAAKTIRIRGINSLRDEGNFPLYIIDGVPINSVPIETNSMFGSLGIDPLNNLDISNIQSIEVLKDADATAIYGSRGANGVVLITTKTGKPGETSLDVRVYSGVSSFPNRLDLLETPEYLALRKKAFENDNVEPDEWSAYDLLIWSQDKNTDWQDFFFGGNAETTDVSIGLSGGSENTYFRLGGGFFEQGTIYPGDYNYKKATGSFNLGHTSKNNRFHINLALSFGLDRNDLLGESDVSQYAFLLSPNAPDLFEEDGDLNWKDWEEVGLDNPLAGYFNNSNIESSNLISNVNFSYGLSRNLFFKTNLGYTTYHSQDLKKRPSRSYNPAYEEPHYSFHLNTNRSSWIVEPQLAYEKQFEDFELDALLGSTFQENTSSILKLQGSGYVSESLIGNLDAAQTVSHASSPENEYRYSAVFARLGAKWRNKYFLNFTGRRDGSSRFGLDNRFANFGAVGAAWIFSEEPLLNKNLPFLSFGKLRGSYGATGNDQIGDYGYLDAYEATAGPDGLYPTGLSNPSFSWEVNKKLEASIQLGFFKDRVNLDASWYRNRTSNQLVGYSLPAITGFTIVQANLPALVQNTGWEFVLSSENIRSEHFQWHTNFNITFPKNELLEYPGIEESPYANTYKVGHPLDIDLLYNYEGIDPETGLYKILDINDDGRLDYEDRTYIRNNSRSYFGGINNTFKIHNFSIQFLWQFVKQKGTINLFERGALGVQRDVVLTGEDNGKPLQKISQTWESQLAYFDVTESNFPIQDASYLRLKTASLGYNLPARLLNRIGLEGGKLFLHGQNLLTVSSYDGLDPETPFSATSFSSLRTITGGIEINF